MTARDRHAGSILQGVVRKMQGSVRTSLVVQLLHDLSDDLAYGLYGLDVVLRLLEVLLEVLQRESNCSYQSVLSTMSIQIHVQHNIRFFKFWLLFSCCRIFYPVC